MGKSLQSDNVQGFGTKWDGVPLSMKRFPEDGLLGHVYKMRLRDSELLKSSMALKTQDTLQLGEDPTMSGLPMRPK